MEVIPQLFLFKNLKLLAGLYKPVPSDCKRTSRLFANVGYLAVVPFSVTLWLNG